MDMTEINGYTVRGLTVREMQDVTRRRAAGELDDEAMSIAVASIAVMKDGVSVGMDAIYDMPWKTFLPLLNAVNRENNEGELAKDAPGNA